jgi:hypothetical protein
MTPTERLRQQLDAEMRRHRARNRRIELKWRLAVAAVVAAALLPVIYEVIRAWMK